MKKLVFIILVLISFDRINAQKPLPIKEQYDFTNNKALFNGTHVGILNYIESGYPINGYAYGEQLGFVLESYINMYKTTGDKAYLIKFINEVLLIMSWRNTDYKFNSLLYMDGILLWPMAHFSNFILYQEPTLSNLIIPISILNIPTSTFSPNILPYQSSYTYGYIANWLIQKQVETLDIIINDNWMGNDKGFKNSTSENSPAEINKQAGFGGALLYLGQLSTNIPTYSGLASYLDKGAAIARLYYSNIDIEDHCTEFPCAPITYNEPLLRISTGNSYWWYHSGWRVVERECSGPSFLSLCDAYGQEPDYFGYTQFVEDISHAVTTLILPQIAYELNLFTNGFYPFSNSEMVRFKNMFTKNIFDGNLTVPGFHNVVNGADGPMFSNDACAPYNCPINSFKYSSLSYMPLYKFDDGDGSSVYDIVMRFYENEPYLSPSNISDGARYNGLAQTVSAQWDKECVDLTLYNRKVIYDQDFIVKNNLVVASQSSDDFYQPGDNSFAEPIINSDEFTIESGVTVNMVAGESINFKTGFHAKAGSNFHAYINPSSCTDGKSVGSFSQNQTNEENNLQKNKYSEIFSDTTVSNAFIRKHQADINQQFKETKSEVAYNSLTIYPNPFNTTTLISFYLEKKSIISLKITNQFGQEVFNELSNIISEQGNHSIEFDGSGLSKGIYNCILNIDGRNVQTKKIVLFK
jgi:hypothetical protein